SPLASGVLTGKYARHVPQGSRLSLAEYGWLKERIETPEGRQRIAKARALEEVAKDLGASLAQLSIAWCLANPNVSTAIVGATKPAQLQENLAALDVLPKITKEVLARIDGVVENKPVVPKAE